MKYKYIITDVAETMVKELPGLSLETAFEMITQSNLPKLLENDLLREHTAVEDFVAIAFNTTRITVENLSKHASHNL